jgi:MscS family membrane protein
LPLRIFSKLHNLKILPGSTIVAFVVLITFVAPVTWGQPADFGVVGDPYPLRGADTSSPRDTLRSFVRNYNAALDAWRNNAPRSKLNRLGSWAVNTFDFSELTTLTRVGSFNIKMALLKEILDRIELPPFDEIPGDQEVAEADISRWTIPNTQIEIVKIQEGPRAGEFLFSRQTVAELENYYAAAKELPYLKGAFVHLYEQMIYSPGSWLPITFPDSFPYWAKWIVFGQGVWQWLALFVVFLVAVSLFAVLYRLGAWWDSRQKNAWLHFGKLLTLLGLALLAEGVKQVAFEGIGLILLPLTVVSYVTFAIQIGSLAWFILLLADRLANAVVQLQNVPNYQQRFDAALLRILFRLISLVILLYLAIYAAGYIGIPIAPLVTGLGVGGLAIALAVRPTLENIIGGLTLFADRPLRVGDFCAYGDKVGTVEEIGLRSTRMRSLDRTVVTIPNAEFSNMQLINYARRDRMLYKVILQLRYETEPDQLRFVLERLRRMLLGHPRVTDDPARARFLDFDAYSLNIEIFAYVNSSDWGEYLGIREDLNLRIIDIVNEAGTGFAFPSQTLYFGRDAGLDAEKGQHAEREVENWRASGELPFPEFAKSLRWELEDILDFPPRGSPDYSPRRGEVQPSSQPMASPVKKEARKRWPFWSKRRDIG